MNTWFHHKGDKKRYFFVGAECIGRDCWSPGMFQHRGATLSGSRNTGSPDSPCCMHNAYHGCPYGPNGLPAFQPKLAQIRSAEGWKKA
jgi:hypothetical protein